MFFCFFLDKLHEWLSILVDSQGTWRVDGPIVWTPELVRHLEASKRNIVLAMDHWIKRTLGSFVIEFAVYQTIIYSEEECTLFKGPRGKYLKSLKTWIKMILYEKRVMKLP